MGLGDNIRYLRIKNGFSQDYVAEMLGYKSYTTIQKWESGVSEPPVKKLKELATLFHADMNDMANSDLTVEENTTLNSKDKRDIAKRLESTLADLEESQKTLMFSGQPLDDETRELLKVSLEHSLQIAKINAKQKFTPKKYRTNE
jgi:transcriptional regulator with XRE-family HTH domain